MKNKVIAAVLLATMLITACNTTTITESMTSAMVVTTTAEETTAEATTTTTETTETTPEITFTDDMLPMTIDEVVETVLSAMGDDYRRLNIDFNENNKSIGIINDAVIVGYTNDFGVEVCICEFDMQSEEYNTLPENSEFEYYFSDNTLGKLAIAAINKQYVMYVCAMPAEDGVIGAAAEWDSEPPYSLGKAQEGYDAFVALS